MWIFFFKNLCNFLCICLPTLIFDNDATLQKIEAMQGYAIFYIEDQMSIPPTKATIRK